MAEALGPMVVSRATVAPRRTGSSLLISLYVCSLTAIGFAICAERCQHWFLVPVLLCGIVITVDAVDWVRGRVDRFDPGGILGVFGVHFFFLAPLLHVAWDSWLRHVSPPDDWRPWLGAMAVLNFVGLLLYRTARARTLRRVQHVPQSCKWSAGGRYTTAIFVVALAFTAGVQVWVYLKYGGLPGYIAAFTSGKSGFQYMGPLFMVSESTPILSMMLFALFARRYPALRSWLTLSFVLVLFVGLQLLFGGLRGSRSHTVMALFWAFGIIHLWLRPVSKRAVVVAGVLVVLFMYFYGFYKGIGSEALQVLGRPDGIADLESRTGRTEQDLLLRDLGRADTQAFLLYRALRPGCDYRYALGRTYVAALAIMVPRALWRNRPPSKVKEGTQLTRGMNSYIPGISQSSRVYGLAGEAMLNFGPLAVPLAFIPLGIVVGLLRRTLHSWRRVGDARLLVLAFLVLFPVTIASADSDNVVFGVFKWFTVPLLVLALGCRRGRVEVGK